MGSVLQHVIILGLFACDNVLGFLANLDHSIAESEGAAREWEVLQDRRCGELTDQPLPKIPTQKAR